MAGRDARVAAADWEEEGTKAAVQETLASPHPHTPKNLPTPPKKTYPHTQKILPTHPKKTYPHTQKTYPHTQKLTHTPKKTYPHSQKKLTHPKNASHNIADQTRFNK